MASAFERPTTTTTTTEDRTELAAKISSSMSDQTKSTESETEDEEVKRNCLRGFREIEESDFNTTDNDSDDDDSDSDDEERQDKHESDAFEGVVKFIGSGVEPLHRDSLIIKPKATTPIKGRLSTHMEEGQSGAEEEEDNMSSSNVSAGIRGPHYSFEGSTDTSSDESEDEEERDDREDEGDEEDNDGTEDDDDEDDESESTSSEEEEGSSIDSDEDESQARSHGSNEVDMSRKMSFEVSDDGIVFDIEEDGNDEELSTIFKAASDEESYVENIERYLGVTEDRSDPISIPKAKRVLSHAALLSLQKDDSGSPESPKRMKVSPDQISDGPPSFLVFDLGPAALAFDITPAGSMLRARPSSPALTSSDDEAWDRQLGEELHSSGDEHDEEEGATAERENTPIPLLTPPQSPLTVEVDGVASTVCEWPSNLAVDSAMAAARELRPMSPDSLQELERAEERRLHDASSTLTPLIRGISFLAK